MKDTDVMAKWMESIEKRLESINTLQTELLNTVIDRTDRLASKETTRGLDGRLIRCERFQDRQKSYWIALMAFGAAVMWIVDKFLDNWDRLKK